MAVTFPTSPTNGQTFTANGLSYVYNATYGVWRLNVSTGSSGGTGGGVTTYATVAELPLTGNSNGDMAFVEETDRLYLSNDNGWFNIALINTSPTITQGGAGSYALATDGTPTVITLTATDPEQIPLTWSYTVTSGALGTTATVTQADNVFTITPGTTDPTDAGTFELTFSVTDGTNIVSDVNSFSLVFSTIVQDSKYTVALITTDGSVGSNSTFTDSSANSLTLTPAGNPSSQSFSPYAAQGYSLQLDGNDYITPGFNDNFGTGDFTFECWVKTTVGGIIMGQYDGGSQMEAFEIITTTGIMASHTDSGTEGAAGTKDLRDNLWHHLVWERHSGTYYYYADGVLQDSRANTENGTQSSGWYIGRHGTANIGYYTGEIRDIKFTVGTAVYGGTTPSVPTETTISGTETFVFATGLPYGKDLSTNGSSRTITSFGDPKFVLEGPYDYAKYDTTKHGGSIYFDGNGDNLTVANSADLQLGTTSAFTAEFWVYVPASNNDYSVLLGKGYNTGTAEWYLELMADGAIDIFLSNNGTNYTYLTASVTGVLQQNTWHHIALVRESSSTIKVYTNGTQSYSNTSVSDWNVDTGPVNIGGYNDGSTQFWSNTYIADVRIVKGTAVYTSNFTPPTEPLSSTGAALHVIGNDADILDKSQTTTLTLVGNTTSSTTQTKYASSSIYFDGTGDYIKIDEDFSEFFDNAWTIEFWVYLNSSSTSNAISIGDGSGVDGMYLLHGGNGFYLGSNGSWNISAYTSSTITVGQWHHCAVTWDGSDYRIFVDGALENTATSSAKLGPGPYTIAIGATYTGAQPTDGYIEDLRLTKGLARYTANFTTPTASLDG